MQGPNPDGPAMIPLPKQDSCEKRSEINKTMAILTIQSVFESTVARLVISLTVPTNVEQLYPLLRHIHVYFCWQECL